MVGRIQACQESLSLPGIHRHPQPPLLSPWPWGMLGGLLRSLPPQLYKALGLTVTLPALQQLQDWVPVGWGVGEGQAGLRHLRSLLCPSQAWHRAQRQEGLPFQVISP